MQQNIPTEQKIKTKPAALVAVIGVFAFAAVAAFAILPGYLEDSNGTTKTVNAKPLKVVDVTRAWADVDQYGPFFPLAYKAGSKLVYSQTQRVGDDEYPVMTDPAGSLSIENTDTSTPLVNSVSVMKNLLMLPKPVHAATPYSIEDLPSTGIPTQMILIRYRQQSDTNESPDRYLTVCIGKTTAQKVYVGTDGSTYTNSKLTKRTTSEPCSLITKRAFAPTKITGGDIVAEPSAFNNLSWEFIRSFTVLGNFTRQGYTTPDTERSVTIPFKTPLYGGHGSQDPAIAPHTPAALFRIESETDGVATTTNVCFPRLNLDQTTGGPLYYFDNQGTAYNDIMLKNRAMATSCPELIAKFYSPETVTKASTAPSLPQDFAVAIINRGKWVGVTSGTLWQTVDNGEARNVTHPLIMTLSGGSVPTATIPSVNVSITDGNNKESELCFAGGTDVTVLSWQLLYYYDTSLRPYKDLFLTEPVTCTPSSTGGGGGTMPRQIPIDNELPIL